MAEEPIRPQEADPQPVPFTEAFGRSDEDAVLSQAACLLLLGAQLDGEPVVTEAAAALRGGTSLVGFAPPEDVERLEVPQVAATGERFDRGRIAARLSEGLGIERDEVREAGLEALPALAAAVEAEPSPLTATLLIEASVSHPEPVVRIAAAIAALPAVADPLRFMAILAEGTRSEDLLVRDLAATGLARFAPEHPALRALLGPSESGEGQPSHTSLLVHGTFARNSPWWQPGGDFHGYLLAQVRPDLYSAVDRFDWSGGYSDGARAVGARDLKDWVTSRGLAGLDLCTHSHGGSVAMLASQNGLDVGRLVLLSCPVHARKYLPDFNRVQDVVSIRVHLDLVILADRGGQRFRDPRIRENLLPLWFRHSATHDAAVWQRHDVPALL